MSEPVVLLENFRRLRSGYYLVRTQAGFKQAIKHWLEVTEYGYSITWREFEGYPTAYPSVVRFEYDHMRTNRKLAHCVPLNEYADDLRAQLAELPITEEPTP